MDDNQTQLNEIDQLNQDKLDNQSTNKGSIQADKDLTVNMTVVGRPSLKSGQILYIGNIGKRWSGYYHIQSCEHTMTPDQGYLCNLVLVRNGERVSKASGSGTIPKGHKPKKVPPKKVSPSNSNANLVDPNDPLAKQWIQFRKDMGFKDYGGSKSSRSHTHVHSRSSYWNRNSSKSTTRTTTHQHKETIHSTESKTWGNKKTRKK